jgi:hypothetical protein
MIRLLAAAAVTTAIAFPAFAQPANMRPTRDVTITYRMSGLAGTPPQETRMAFSASTGKQRVDPPGGAGWILIDRRANSAVMVLDAQRMAMTLPPAAVAAMNQDAPAGATFTRKGTATVAGTACTEWEIAIGQMRGTNCMTDDGVMLRTASTAPDGTAVTMEATQVTYGVIDPARLAVPAGYTTQQMPTGAPPPAR